MPWLNKRWISFFAIDAAILITVVSILGWQNYKAGVSVRSSANAYGVDGASTDAANLFTNWTSADPVLGAIIDIDSFDPGKSSSALGFRIDFTPINQLLSSTSNETTPALPVRVVLMSKTTNFPAGTVIPFQSVSQMLDGDINSYPFDVYTVNFTMSAYTSPSNTSYGVPLHNTVFVQGAVQGFNVESSFLGMTDDGSQLQISFTVRRSGVSKAFAVIIFIVMWCLSLSIFTAAMSIWFRERKVELPLIAISTALLFALPNVRNSQPGIPPVAGTTSDMVGFFWNLLLVAISAISLLINWIVKNARERPAKTTVVDTEGGRGPLLPMK